MQQPYRSWVEVSRSRIAANYQAVRRAVGDAVTIMPVVKADAYRHGAIEISRVLEDLLVRETFEKVHTGVRLALIGDAPYADEYIRRVRDNSDSRIVILVPFTDRAARNSSRIAWHTSTLPRSAGHTRR